MVDTYTKEALQAFMKERIRQAISEHPMTAEALAEKLQLSKAAVSKWARDGKIQHHNLYALASLTGRPVGWFYPPTESGSLSDTVETLDAMTEAEVDEAMALLRALLEKNRASS